MKAALTIERYTAPGRAADPDNSALLAIFFALELQEFHLLAELCRSIQDPDELLTIIASDATGPENDLCRLADTVMSVWQYSKEQLIQAALVACQRDLYHLSKKLSPVGQTGRLLTIALAVLYMSALVFEPCYNRFMS